MIHAAGVISDLYGAAGSEWSNNGIGALGWVRWIKRVGMCIYCREGTDYECHEKIRIRFLCGGRGDF